MDFWKVIAALPLVAGSHALGHIDYADRKGFDVTINTKDLTEQMKPLHRKVKVGIDSDGNDILVDRDILPTNSDKANYSGGSFATQDKITNRLKLNEIYLANAIYKLGYLAQGKNINKDDFTWIGKTKSKDAKHIAKVSVGITALNDILKAYGKGLPDNQDLGFWTSDTGTPGLMYTRRF